MRYYNNYGNPIKISGVRYISHNLWLQYLFPTTMLISATIPLTQASDNVPTVDEQGELISEQSRLIFELTQKLEKQTKLKKKYWDANKKLIAENAELKKQNELLEQDKKRRQEAGRQQIERLKAQGFNF